MLLFCCATLPAQAETAAKNLYKQGEILYGAGKTEKAMLLYDRALLIEPDWSLCLMRKAQCLHQIQEDEEALPFINRALLKDPNVAGYNLVKSTILSALGKYDEALVFARKACNVIGPFAEADATLARALLNCHKYEEAQTFLTAKLKAFPNDAQMRSARIKVGIVLGKWDQVVADCTISYKSLRPLSPSLVRVLTDRAEAYKHLKKYDLAIKDYEEILRAVHDYRPAHSGLKDLYKLSGNKKMFDKEMKFLESLDQDSEPPI